MFFLLMTAVVAMKNDLNLKDTNPKSSDLINKIRRQLMQDNYDYLPMETEEDFSPNHNAVNEYKSPEKIIDDYDYHEHDKQRFNITDVIAPRAYGYEDKEEGKDKVSKTDLVYYLNDDRIGLTNDYYGNEHKNVNDDKVKYKVMKLKSTHPNRRSLFIRRFIQKQDQNGVALMNLDDEPFPDFKLPKSRRQYMQQSSETEEMENLMEDFSFEDY